MTEEESTHQLNLKIFFIIQSKLILSLQLNIPVEPIALELFKSEALWPGDTLSDDDTDDGEL